ncbi:hypothetical protein PAHAL_9G073100 [Panicum hallii]|jgi:hypothetical protein|uniref:Uncharacterized protein n=1 Tax=Panicum hallii TaxID=206008 RepID=A0A2T8I0L9_9POAL|nr:hypothetical protein PAHAL_9G073100 [Panicum hallii]
MDVLSGVPLEYAENSEIQVHVKKKSPNEWITISPSLPHYLAYANRHKLTRSSHNTRLTASFKQQTRLGLGPVKTVVNVHCLATGTSAQ